MLISAHKSNSFLMQETMADISNLVEDTRNLMLKMSIAELRFKPSKDKWSKLEILGHLIDSAINNLQRFTEIPFAPRPYHLRSYNQDQLVTANDYQHADPTELLHLWQAINRRIIRVVDALAPQMSTYQIIREEEQIDLKFLIEDYLNHMRHHLAQIVAAASEE
jgi:hypothetical protein